MLKHVVVKAVLFNTKGEVLLVRRSETAPRRALEWDFPGGWVDGGDASYQASCLREVAEEAGLTVVDDRVELAYAESSISTKGDEPINFTLLFFEGVAASTDVKLGDEHDKFTWVTLDRAADLITYDKHLRALQHLIKTR